MKDIYGCATRKRGKNRVNLETVSMKVLKENEDLRSDGRDTGEEVVLREVR